MSDITTNAFGLAVRIRDITWPPEWSLVAHNPAKCGPMDRSLAACSEEPDAGACPRHGGKNGRAGSSERPPSRERGRGAGQRHTW